MYCNAKPPAVHAIRCSFFWERPHISPAPTIYARPNQTDSNGRQKDTRPIIPTSPAN